MKKIIILILSVLTITITTSCDIRHFIDQLGLGDFKKLSLDFDELLPESLSGNFYSDSYREYPGNYNESTTDYSKLNSEKSKDLEYTVFLTHLYEVESIFSTSAGYFTSVYKDLKAFDTDYIYKSGSITTKLNLKELGENCLVTIVNTHDDGQVDKIELFYTEEELDNGEEVISVEMLYLSFLPNVIAEDPEMEFSTKIKLNYTEDENLKYYYEKNYGEDLVNKKVAVRSFESSEVSQSGNIEILDYTHDNNEDFEDTYRIYATDNGTHSSINYIATNTKDKLTTPSTTNTNMKKLFVNSSNGPIHVFTESNSKGYFPLNNLDGWNNLNLSGTATNNVIPTYTLTLSDNTTLTDSSSTNLYLLDSYLFSRGSTTSERLISDTLSLETNGGNIYDITSINSSLSSKINASDISTLVASLTASYASIKIDEDAFNTIDDNYVNGKFDLVIPEVEEE